MAMNKNTKNILIAAGVTALSVAAVGTLYHFTVKSMMKLALDRKEPKIMNKGREKLMGSEELSVIMGKLMDAAEKLESQDHETVEITADDGVRLVAHWYPCEGAKRVIVAMHGWRSDWSRDFGIISQFWHKNGCSVLYAEQRGQGDSGGEYMGFGLLERYDCLRWVNWVQEHTDSSLPIYLAGISMGASTVLMTSGFELPERVHGIMADCGFTSPHAIWKYVVQNNLKIPYGLYSAVADELCRKKIQVSSKDFSCAQALENCKIPVLFIHGTDDHFVPVEMTFENYKACKGHKRLLVVPGADHGMSFLVDTQGYENAMTEFFKDFD
ncbi:MAG: alpha/beta hydrolase [Ruminococcus sp.]|nr:alpha/beta hydrolase [Ruminococcus sp.]